MCWRRLFPIISPRTFSLFVEKQEILYICISELLLLTIYNIVRIMKKRRLILMLICCLETMMFPFSTRAESGYVGDEFGLDRPSVFVAYPYKVLEIQNVSWDYDYSCFSCYQTSGGLHVRITKYFETSKTITCEVRYKWGTSDGKNIGRARKGNSIPFPVIKSISTYQT